MEKIKSILKIIGSTLTAISAIMSSSVLVALYYREFAVVGSFIAAILMCLFVSIIFRCVSKGSDYILKYRDGYAVVTIVWITVTLIGSVPYIASGILPNFFDAYFESCSGYSTTGSTVINDIEALPKSVIFYRALTQWIGGMGILVFLSMILPSWGINGQTLGYNESPGPMKGKFDPKFADTSRSLYQIYFFLTGSEIVILRLCGLSLFDSVVHTFATVSTGGFSSYNDSAAHFSSFPLVIAVLIIYMFLSSISFNIYLSVIRKGKAGLDSMINDEELKWYWMIIVISALLICTINTSSHMVDIEGSSLLNSVFQVVSIMSTTGFSTFNFDVWPTASKMIILSLIFIGGCAQSTAGGVKVVRLLVSLQLLKRSFLLKLHPNRISTISFNEKEIPNDSVIRITTFIFTYILVFYAGVILLSIDGHNMATNISLAASCLCNVGPGLSYAGPSRTLFDFSNFSKLICSIMMIIGRLEILPVFALFSRHYWNTNKA